MKSVKPGRGPSMPGGVVGLFMIGFGILNATAKNRYSVYDIQ